VRPARRLHVLVCAVLTAGAVATVGLQVPAAAAPAAAAPRTATTSETLRQQVEQLNAQIERVSAQLAERAVEYESAEDALGRLTQQQFAARADREALAAAEAESRDALQGLARAAYKGGVPPMVSALLSGEPGALGNLAYVQRSVNRAGASRSDATRDLVAKQAGAGRALERSDALRRQALTQQQALEQQRVQLAEETDRLTADLRAAGARLIQARAAEAAAEQARQQARQQEAAAARFRAAAEQAATQASAQAAAAARARAAGLPYAPGGTGGQCQPPSATGEANGFLSEATLCPLETAPSHRLRTDAARAFDALSRARQAASGSLLCVTDSYRDFAGQVDVFRRKPQLAATPGRSQHGWGLAVDLGCGVQSFGSEPHRWMQQNAAAFGFHHPRWAQQDGSRPEAWHWEYAG
jgi:hypothetical protein